jgi:hypothetical protein
MWLVTSITFCLSSSPHPSSASPANRQQTPRERRNRYTFGQKSQWPIVAACDNFVSRFQCLQHDVLGTSMSEKKRGRRIVLTELELRGYILSSDLFICTSQDA